MVFNREKSGKEIVSMKKYILCLVGLLLLGCSRPQKASPVPPTEQPAPTPAPTVTVTLVPETAAPETMLPETQVPAEDERIVGHCLSILDELPCAVDLDGDGILETVDLATYVAADEYPRWALTISKDSQQKRFETDIPYDMPYDLFVGDLDEDGGYELFFHGDLASDDYLIYGFHSDLSCLFFEPDERAVRWEAPRESNVFAGRIEGFEDGHIVIEGVVDMLGTHWGIRNFALGDDGVIGPVSTVWTFNDEIEADRLLVVTRELTAYKAAVRKDPGEAFTLQPGEKILPLASDGCERLWFETAEGKGGVLLLTPDEENMWLIDGVPEAEYFESLPYAG